MLVMALSIFASQGLRSALLILASEDGHCHTFLNWSSCEQKIKANWPYVFDLVLVNSEVKDKRQTLKMTKQYLFY